MQFTLTSKSGYFKKRLNDTLDIELPETFPGGPETFEMIALFVYGSSTMIDPFNVAALRCAAEFLELTEEYCSCNLCERFDLYLNQVVLQSWDDTLITLQRCKMLLPWSEDLLIVSRCIESLAFMACMEILDPERRRDTPIVTMEDLANSQAWSCGMMKDFVVSQEDLWMKDLIALPFDFFKRVVGSLRRQGMKEKFVSPIIVFYAHKWILSKKRNQFIEEDANLILQGVIDLLLSNGDKAKSRKVIPVGFYFALLSRSLELGLRSDSKVKLQDQITSLLHFAQVEDFLLPESGTVSMSSSMELATMESIISAYVMSNSNKNNTSEANNFRVAQLWDTYLSNVAVDLDIGPMRFMELIERMPPSYRQNHYPLYRAINNFLKVSKCSQVLIFLKKTT